MDSIIEVNDGEAALGVADVDLALFGVHAGHSDISARVGGVVDHVFVDIEEVSSFRIEDSNVHSSVMWLTSSSQGGSCSMSYTLR